VVVERILIPNIKCREWAFFVVSDTMRGVE
jgi:hypothetical protein